MIGAMLRRGMTATVIGLLAGLLPAFALSRLLAFVVWSVDATVGRHVHRKFPPVLAVVAAIAIYIPRGAPSRSIRSGR